MTPAPVGLRCPEHSGKPQGVQRVTRPAQRAVTGVGARRTNVVTLTLIAINVLVYLAELAAGGTVDGQRNTIYYHGSLVASAQYSDGSLAGVSHGEWWRLFTAAFLHYGPLHLAVNMYSLYITGSLLEHVIGRWRFVLLYVVAGLAGSTGALIASPDAITVGASGAIFGVFGALFVLERSRHIASGGQIAGLIILNLVFSFLLPGISIGGHIGGLIAGVVLMWVLLNVRRSTALSVAATVAAGAIAVAIAIWRARGYA
jgi:membrane associated rhomboid family serine protease